MKKLIVLVMVGIAGACSAAAAEGEIFNFGWKFRMGEVTNGAAAQLDDAAWRPVDLPHDFQMEMAWSTNAYRLRGFKPTGAGWYRKHFAYDPQWAGRHVYLDFGGIMFCGDVYVNGRHVKASDAGYYGFEVDITRALKPGMNVVAVRAHTGENTGARWYTGGGIYRDVRLFTKGKIRFARHGAHVTTPEVTPACAQVRVQVEVEGFRDATNALDAVVTLLDPAGNVCGTARVAVPLNQHKKRIAVAVPDFTLAKPALWSCETPTLYTAVATLVRGNQTLDTMRTRFGVRTIAYGPDFGFRLNGRKVFLKGVANHHDLGALGAAAFDKAIARRLKILKDYGFNAVRCSHNPYSEGFMRLCDELGILVVDEMVDFWKGCWAGRRPFMEQWPELCTEFIRRDRNHPCVILWSLGNETQRDESAGYETDDFGVTSYRIFDVMVKRWDATRPTTVALFPARAGYVKWREPQYKLVSEPPEMAPIQEVTSFNYVWDQFAHYRALYPQMIFFQSEATVRALLHPYFGMDHAREVGLCYWGAVEYWGETFKWPQKGWNYSFFRHSMDPNPTAALMRSAFKPEEPLVHVTVKTSDKSEIWNAVEVGASGYVDDWNLTPGMRVDVAAFTGGDAVAFRLNGAPLGLVTNGTENVFLLRNVAWALGKLEAIAQRGGKEWARAALETTGPAVRLALEAETPESWRADGMDLQYVRVMAVDAQGRRVRNAKGVVRFAVSGAATLLATEDGDHSTDALFNTPEVKLHQGVAWAILRAARQPGAVELKAESPFGAARIGLQVR